MNPKSPEPIHPHLEALEHLFAVAPPTPLRRSVEELYHAFLAEPTAVLPSKEMAVHLYFLIRFLNEIEKHARVE